MKISFTLPGAPRTKKTHNVLSLKGRRPILLPSKEYRAWHKSVLTYVELACVAYPRTFPISTPCAVRALFYREADVGDLTGYMDALGDFLQSKDVRILKNDRLIESWDGSRRMKDAARPRIEVEITVGEAQLNL